MSLAENKMNSYSSRMTFEEVDLAQLSCAVGIKPMMIKRRGEEVPLSLSLPSDMGHISFSSPVPSEGRETKRSTFLRLYGTDPEGRFQNTDYTLDNSTIIFEAGQANIVLSNTENDLGTEYIWISLSPENVFVHSTDALGEVPATIQQALQDRNQ